MIGDWKHEYNNYRPQSSLGWRSPVDVRYGLGSGESSGPTLKGGPIDGVRSGGVIREAQRPTDGGSGVQAEGEECFRLLYGLEDHATDNQTAVGAKRRVM
jgi:hypothetical protein